MIDQRVLSTGTAHFLPPSYCLSVCIVLCIQKFYLLLRSDSFEGALCNTFVYSITKCYRIYNAESTSQRYILCDYSNGNMLRLRQEI